MPDTIMTKCGPIRGTTCQWDNVIAYKGIRYATAGRWEYPAPVTKWDGVYEATEYGNCSYQPRAFYNEEEVIEKVFYYNEFRKGATYQYDDDCLFLNIWTPASATPDSKLPVIFYIHGGGYTGGCGHEKHFDGPIWPTQDVIAVTCNYRLGPMGFLCLPELEEEAGHTGNYGLYDQLAALQWVHDNIEAFGGDAHNVTIMGQSAGAMSVQIHCTSPLTEGLFAKAAMNSGGGVHKLMNSEATTKDRYAFWEQVKSELGCNNLEELREVEPSQLFATWQRLKKTNIKYAVVASPCIDGHFMTKSVLAAANAAEQKNIPYMMGSTGEDMATAFMHGMVTDWCLRQDKTHKQPSYGWFFDRRLPGDDNGAWHSSELWYFFGTLANGWRPFEKQDYALSEFMSTALCNFAKTGNPNGGKVMDWQPTTSKQKNVMICGEQPAHMGKPSKLKLWKTMLTNKSVGE